MRKNILIVDDHEALRNSLRDLLIITLPDCGIVEARSGEEAIEIANTTPLDLVIMDIGLPGINGVKSTKIILDDNPELVVIMLSTYEEEKYLNEARMAGASCFVSKRNMHVELLPAMTELLGAGK